MITLTPETEAQLKTVAHYQGLSAEEALIGLIAEAAEVAEAIARLHPGTAKEEAE